jgi:hypothetical protein
VNPRTNVAIGATAILLALLLVPLIWGCGESVSGWNVLIFGLIAGGASQLGAAAGRWTDQRLVGIAVTVAAVLLALLGLGLATAGTCS